MTRLCHGLQSRHGRGLGFLYVVSFLHLTVLWCNFYINNHPLFLIFKQCRKLKVAGGLLESFISHYTKTNFDWHTWSLFGFGLEIFSGNYPDYCNFLQFFLICMINAFGPSREYGFIHAILWHEYALYRPKSEVWHEQLCQLFLSKTLRVFC